MYKENIFIIIFIKFYKIYLAVCKIKRISDYYFLGNCVREFQKHGFDKNPFKFSKSKKLNDLRNLNLKTINFKTKMFDPLLRISQIKTVSLFNFNGT